jgi:hypothetical protein
VFYLKNALDIKGLLSHAERQISTKALILTITQRVAKKNVWSYCTRRWIKH